MILEIFSNLDGSMILFCELTFERGEPGGSAGLAGKPGTGLLWCRARPLNSDLEQLRPEE